MTLIINNQEVQQVLTMEDTVAALEQRRVTLADLVAGFRFFEAKKLRPVG